MSAQDNAKIVRELYAAFGRGDIAAVTGAMAEDVDWNMPGTFPSAGRRSGRRGVQEFFAQVAELTDIEQFDARHFVAQNDKVVVTGDERLRVRRTGARVEQQWAHVYTLRDGKITGVQLFTDTHALAAAFGETPAERAAELGPMGVTEPPYSGRGGQPR